MRRSVAVLAILTVFVGLVGVLPASATHISVPSDPHCNSGNIASNAACRPATVIMFEGPGKVCNGAEVPAARCTYKTDRFWAAADEYKGYKLSDFNAVTPTGCTWGQSGCSIKYPALQGLYLPEFGPPADGPFTFTAGDAFTPPRSFCVASVGGDGCKFNSKGRLYTGDELDVGAYCGSSKGVGTATFTAAGNPTPLVSTSGFSWEQSAGSILPLFGTVTDTTPNGGEGATVQGFATSRGFLTPNNELGCGVQVPVTTFATEGMVVVY